jgi:hypothetical protein
MIRELVEEQHNHDGPGLGMSPEGRVCRATSCVAPSRVRYPTRQSV